LKKKVVIFDLDGTLIDSIKDIAIATNKVLEKLEYEKHPLDAYANFVGDGALMLLKNALPNEVSQKTLEKAVDLFKEIYGDKIHKYTKPYEGIYKMLDSISNKGLSLAVLSNKPHIFTVEFIDYFFKDYPFVQIHGQKENVTKKPSPQGILNIANALHLQMNDIVFIGDTPTDIKTAKNANVTSIAVSWGYRSVEELKNSKPDYIADDTQHLTTLLLENNF